MGRALLVSGAASALLCLPGPLSTSALAADGCANAPIREQQRVTALPDCRAYELVNPSTDDIGEVNRLPYIADDGNTVSYVSALPGDSALGGGVAAISVARRAGSVWSSVSADPTSRGSIWGLTGVTVPKVFSTDFKTGILDTTFSVTPEDTNGVPDYYRVNVGQGTAKLMTPGLDAFPVLLQGATPNLERIVYLKDVGTTPVPGLYASDGNGPPELQSVYPDNVTPVPPGLAQPAGAAYQRGFNITNGSSAPFVERGGQHGVSDDARRVYFYDGFSPQPDIGDSGILYVRDHQQTINVSASARTGDVGTPNYAQFISASHSGGSVYFNAVAQLTNTATPGGGIYRYDLDSSTLTQITPDANDPAGLHLQNAISSDDQSHIYFTSTAALGGGAQAGDANAYVWTAADGIRFIAKVNSSEGVVRTTPDGRFAVLLSTASINGAPNNGFRAVYRYDYQANQTVCVSCRANGSPSQGTAGIEEQSYGQPAASLARSRALTFDGRVVFTSTDRVSPNDQTAAQDVYLYENGAASLLTRGKGDSNSYIGDVSDDGKNVFVITRDALVGADRDAAEYDLYDVRVDGGVLEPPPPSDPCHGEDCQGPATPAPGQASPSSIAGGSTNVTPAKITKKLSVSGLTASQRKTLARTGKVTVTAHVTGGGTVTVRGRGSVGGQTKTVASGSERVLKRNETAVKVSVKLTAAARRQLARRGRLSVKIEARLSGLSKVLTSTANLSRAHR